jgi:hemolysin III
MVDKYTDYSPKEELINVISHGAGLVLSIPATILLIIKALPIPGFWGLASVIIFGLSLFLLYLASTLYHSAKKPELRKKLNVLDHSAIYLLIAGSYTPFLLLALKGSWGWSLFGIVWAIAAIGIFMKILFSQRYKILSAIAYVGMGWIIVIAIKPLIYSMSALALQWLFIGGLSYTIGAVLYVFKKIPFNHAIFHIFVLGGSISHWISVYYFVL